MTELSQITHREERLHTRPELIFLPHCLEDSIDFVRRAWPYFSEDKYLRNLRIVQSVIAKPHLYRENEAITETAWRIAEIIKRLAKYGNRIRGFYGSPSVVESLAQRLPGLEREGKDTVRIQELKQIARERLNRARGDLLFFSSSHVTTYPEIEALHEIVPDAKIGIIVFDRHMDFYQSSLDLPTGESDIGKRNVFLFLINKRLIDGIAFIGFPKSNRAQVLEKRATPNETFALMRFFYKSHQGMITVADEGRYLVENKGRHLFNTQAYILEVQKQVEFLQNTGVTHIVFSIDPDILRLEEFGYTALDYNTVGFVLSLGLQDFSTAEAAARVKLREQGKTPDPKSIERLRDRKILMAVEDLSFLIGELKGIVVGIPKDIAGYGLPLGAIGRGIDAIRERAKELGIQIGVPLPEGGRFVGDIVELSAPDYQGRTAIAVEGIAKRILR